MQSPAHSPLDPPTFIMGSRSLSSFFPTADSNPHDGSSDEFDFLHFIAFPGTVLRSLWIVALASRPSGLASVLTVPRRYGVQSRREAPRLKI